MSVNKVILLGNIGQQPEVRALPSGQRVATFGVATSDRYKDKQTGEQKELTEWHNCVAWGQQCDFIERYLGKGSKVYVEGRLRSRDYTTQRGEQRRVTEIVAVPPVTTYFVSRRTRLSSFAFASSPSIGV